MSKVHRPYLDKMSSRTTTPSLQMSSSNKNIHILPNLLHTGLTPSCREASPPVMLPDGSLNRKYISSTHHQTCRQVNRDVIELESRPLSFKTKSTKRINRDLKKLLDTKNMNDTAMQSFMEKTIHSPLTSMRKTATSSGDSSAKNSGRKRNKDYDTSEGGEFQRIPEPASDGSFNDQVFERRNNQEESNCKNDDYDDDFNDGIASRPFTHTDIVAPKRKI